MGILLNFNFKPTMPNFTVDQLREIMF